MPVHQRKIKAFCPTSSAHTDFLTTGEVVEEWKVNAYGEHIETVSMIDVSRHPTTSDRWTCATCGEDAEFMYEER